MQRYKQFKGYWRTYSYDYTFTFNAEHFKKAGVPNLWGGMPIVEAHQLINHMNREAKGEWTYWLEDEWKPQILKWE